MKTIQIISIIVLIFLHKEIKGQVMNPEGRGDSRNLINVETEKPPIAYVHVREADLMWAKRIWRLIDLREKWNQMYLYPAVPNNERINLISLIQLGIQNGHLTPYDPLAGDDFQQVMDREKALSIGTSIDSVLVPDPNPPYTEKMVAITSAFDPMWVKQYKVKEDWFFDKKRSVMEVRIISICPVMEVYDKESGELRGLQDMYWIDFNEARNWFSQYKIYNKYNFASAISYDDAFQKRMFTSLIYKEDNTHDRMITEFLSDMEALHEAEDVKSKIMIYEHDLWEY